MSKTKFKADVLRAENKFYNNGFWNVFNMSNRQIIKKFGDHK